VSTGRCASRLDVRAELPVDEVAHLIERETAAFEPGKQRADRSRELAEQPPRTARLKKDDGIADVANCAAVRSSAFDRERLAAQLVHTRSSRTISIPDPPGSSIHLPLPPSAPGRKWTFSRTGYSTERVSTTILVWGVPGTITEAQTSQTYIHFMA